MTFKPKVSPLIEKLQDPDYQGMLNFFSLVRDRGLVFLATTNGLILTQEEFEALVAECRKFYGMVTPEQVGAHNEHRTEELSKPPSMPPKPKRQKPKHGYVYLVGGGDHYKIGKTVNVDRRLTQVSLQLPFEIELIHTIETDDITLAEETLHAEFADKRTNGEWFDFEPVDIEFISSIRSFTDGQFLGADNGQIQFPMGR